MKTVKLLLGIAASMHLITTAYAQSSLTNGLVAYYPFNGNANDESGNGNDGVATNTTKSIDRYGILSGSFDFNGSNSFVWVGTNVRPALISATVWINTTNSVVYNTNNWQGLFNIIRDSSFGYALYITPSGTVGSYLYRVGSTNAGNWSGHADSTLNATNITCNDGRWHFIAVTYDGYTHALFIDGVLQQHIYFTNSAGVYYYNPGGLSIGRDGHYSDGYYDGTIDDVRIYNRSLTSGEITQLYAIPTIHNQPQSLTTNQGATATFNVSATETNGVWVQWYKDGVGLPNATNTTLTITNAQPPNIGNYSVVVNGYGGSVTSSVVSLSLNGVNSDIWQGLVAYYPFNGNANDATGIGNDGIVHNATSDRDRFGDLNSAYRFNITNHSFIQVPNPVIPVGTNARTVNMWITCDRIPTNIFRAEFMLGYGDTLSVVHGSSFTMVVDYLEYLYMEGGFVDYGVYNLGHNLFNGDWHMLCFTLKTNVVKGYLDGRAFAWSAVPTPGSVLNTMQADLYIGSWANQYFDGHIDDVRIYNRALSSNEVAQLYASEAVPPAITTEPFSIVADAHTEAEFIVTATGTPPLSYQWTFNGTNLIGSTESELILTNITPSNLGNYRVIITNVAGQISSSVVTLYMYPYIAIPFGGAVTYWGQSNTFSVTAWGSYLQYQWYLDGVAIPNATTADLVIPAIQLTNAGMYSVVVSSIFDSATNTPVQVVVNPANVSLKLCPNVVIQGTVGYSYIIQMTMNLLNTNAWTTMTNLTLTQPIQYWDDISDDSTKPGRYYRVLPGQ